MRMENALYEASELKLNGITRQIDEERRRFEHPNRELFLRRRDEIYAINAMMRERERRRFEEYVLATQMSEERAAAMRLEESTAPAADLAAAGSASSADSCGHGDGQPESSHWRQLRRMFSDVVQAIDRARPLSNAELEAMRQVQKEAARRSMAEEAARMALLTTVDEVLDEVLAEAAVDVGAEHVLTANGIGIECEVAPSEVYKRAMDAAQREFDKATKAYQRSERARLAKEREELRAAALNRKVALERAFKDVVAIASSPQQKGRPPSAKRQTSSPKLATASRSPPSPDVCGPDSRLVC